MSKKRAFKLKNWAKSAEDSQSNTFFSKRKKKRKKRKDPLFLHVNEKKKKHLLKESKSENFMCLAFQKTSETCEKVAS